MAALATPPTDVYPAMFVGMAMLAFSVRDTTGWWRGFGLGALWGTAGGLLGMRFVPSVIQMFTDLGTVAAYAAHLLLSLGQSLHWALGMGLCALLRRRLRTPLEIAFPAGVLLALMIPSVFVWSPAGLLSPWPLLVQGADLVGERGVSVLFALIAALAVRVALAWRAGDRRGTLLPAGAIGLLLAIMLGHGAWAMARWSRPTGDSARLALIHAAVDPKVRWKPDNWPSILSTLRNVTGEAERAGVDLSVWPEAAYPYPLPHGSRQAPRRQRQIIGGNVDGPVLFGFIANELGERLPSGEFERNRYNSATLVLPDRRVLPSYDKMELLWFGETVPLGQYFPWLRRLFQRSGGLIPGKQLRAQVLERPARSTLTMGVFNCYEDTLPGLGRRVATELHPNLLVNVTNDAWFVGTQEPELHLRLAVMRSIELRRAMVRAVNLGVPAWIDAAGRVVLRSDDPGPGSLLVEPQLHQGPATLYARLGDWPTIATLGLAAAAVAAPAPSTGGSPPPRKPTPPSPARPGAAAERPARARGSGRSWRAPGDRSGGRAPAGGAGRGPAAWSAPRAAGARPRSPGVGRSPPRSPRHPTARLHRA